MTSPFLPVHARCKTLAWWPCRARGGLTPVVPAAVSSVHCETSPGCRRQGSSPAPGTHSWLACCLGAIWWLPGSTTKQNEQILVLAMWCSGTMWWPPGATTKQHDSNNSLNSLSWCCNKTTWCKQQNMTQMMVLTACCPGATTKKHDTNDGSNNLLSWCHKKKRQKKTQTTVLTACCPGATWWPSGAAAKQHDTNNDLNFLLTKRLNNLLSWHLMMVTWYSNKIMCFNSSSWCHMMVNWCHNKITWHKWQSLQHVLVP